MRTIDVDRPQRGDSAWAVYKEGGALHLWVYDLHSTGQPYWLTPCGRIISRTGPPLDQAASSQYYCGRCVQLRQRQVDAPGPACVGCTDEACTVCSPPTEGRMLDWLNRHYTRRGGGNGFRYHYLTQVRSGPDPDARTADAVAMDTWQPSGFELHGHEVKVSRENWLMELADPQKWRPVGAYMDRWWLTVPDMDFIELGEVPEQWGVLVVRPHDSEIARPAPFLRPKPLDRPFVSSLIRAALRSEK